ncbi:acyltransferase [Roseovarius sp. S4756]|uniref:acyltransferase n=1 Tax=Roseovarius maritimus TaxID=3342637 RepID=UPI003726A876
MNAQRIGAAVVSTALKWPFASVPEVPLSTVVGRCLTLACGLLRGLLPARRRIVLGRGARISDADSLHISGRTVLIDDYCLVDCNSHEGITLGRNFKLGTFSRMFASGTLVNIGKGIVIGDNVGTGEFAQIGGAGGVKIGADCIFGAFLSVHPENDIFSDPAHRIREQGLTRSGIEIGSGCWIGVKVTVTVLDGVKIGRGSVISADSVMTKSFPERSVIGGVPARLMRPIDDLTKTE